jgi:hypothetical protein
MTKGKTVVQHTEHTVAPWRIYDRTGDICIQADDAGGVTVATIDCEYPEDRIAALADARLIAAAPDLLEACQMAMPHHQGGHSAVGAALRTAIAKATGEPANA